MCVQGVGEGRRTTQRCDHFVAAPDADGHIATEFWEKGVVPACPKEGLER